MQMFCFYEHFLLGILRYQYCTLTINTIAMQHFYSIFKHLAAHVRFIKT